MRVLVAFVVACLGLTAPTFAQSTRPSEASVRHLLDVMQARQIVQTMSAQMDTMFDNMVNKQLEGRT